MTAPHPIKTMKSLTWPNAKETGKLSTVTVCVAVLATVALWGIGLALTAAVAFIG